MHIQPPSSGISFIHVDMLDEISNSINITGDKKLSYILKRVLLTMDICYLVVYRQVTTRLPDEDYVLHPRLRDRFFLLAILYIKAQGCVVR